MEKLKMCYEKLKKKKLSFAFLVHLNSHVLCWISRISSIEGYRGYRGIASFSGNLVAQAKKIIHFLTLSLKITDNESNDMKPKRRLAKKKACSPGEASGKEASSCSR